jgi:RNA polymerase sigma-70 factor (ECF subfamily)
MQLISFNKNRRNKNDTELLGIYLKTGDFDVLGELYARYMHLVYGVCLKYFKEPEKAKDTVIEIYEKIQAEIYRHKIKNFKSWLYVVTKNYCLMELRKTKKGELVLVENDEKLAGFMETDAELHPIDKERDDTLEKALADCIARLKEEQQKCINLFYFENLCYREIAEQLKIEEKKVKSFIQNGKRNLKICLEGQNDR